MKELKFRAWDKHYKHWLKAEAMELNVKMNPVGNGMFTILPLDEFIAISQFTGLEDKNRREIYEGDVIRAKNGDAPDYISEIWRVVYDHGSFTAINERERSETEIEVIGNIYENPELLKKPRQ